MGLAYAGGLLTFSLAAASDLYFSIRYPAVNEEEVIFIPFPVLCGRNLGSSDFWPETMELSQSDQPEHGIEWLKCASQ